MRKKDGTENDCAIPLLEGNIGEPGIVDPAAKAMNRLALKGTKIERFPKKVILCFFKDFYKLIKREYAPRIYEYHDDFNIYVFTYKKDEFAFLYPTVGSYASVILEEIVALGGKEIISIGGVGTVASNLLRGDIILPVKAIRDEGVSYQYQRPGPFSYPSSLLLGRIRETLLRHKLSWSEGASWTISTVYAETVSKLENLFSL
jgi:uridine phosphorylase